MKTQYDLIIVGGGAGGLCAAAFAARKASEVGKPLRIAVLERGKRVGRKLAVTGNGTCNISHAPLSIEAYHGKDPHFIMPALNSFGPEESMAYFQRIGVETYRREDGRIYPICLQASAVLDCLRAELQGFHVDELCETEVSQLQPINGQWNLRTDKGMFVAKCVIVASGGAASPSVGGCTNGYTLLKALGCECVSLFPSVVPVKTDTTYVRAVKGVRIDASVSFSLNGKTLSSACDEILFTEYGLSGPAVMQSSRPVGEWETHKKGEMAARLDLFPDFTMAELKEKLSDRRQLNGRNAEDWLTGLIHKRIGQTLLRMCGIPMSAPLSTITDEQVATVAACAKDWKLQVTGTTGFSNAQVTAGGISTNAFDPHTLECRKHRGLYAIGEVLDVDGDCGGYNLQWAWSSAMVAASHVLKVQGIL